MVKHKLIEVYEQGKGKFIASHVGFVCSPTLVNFLTQDELNTLEKNSQQTFFSLKVELLTLRDY